MIQDHRCQKGAHAQQPWRRCPTDSKLQDGCIRMEVYQRHFGGRRGIIQDKWLVPDAILSRAPPPNHAPFVSSNLCQFYNWRRSDDMHWQSTYRGVMERIYITSSKPSNCPTSSRTCSTSCFGIAAYYGREKEGKLWQGKDWATTVSGLHSWTNIFLLYIIYRDFLEIMVRNWWSLYSIL